MRLDRPIGIWLLFWPCVFGLQLGASFLGYSYPPGLYVLLVAIGSILMRGAGCTYNDIVDRDIDARVARTRGRPIPSGAVSVRQAWIFVAVAACPVLWTSCFFFNRFAALIALARWLWSHAYPFMKRMTWWPQAWLGLTFNWGVPFGFAAMIGETGHLAGTVLCRLLLLDPGLRHALRAHRHRGRFADRREIFGDRLGDTAYPWLYAFYAAALSLMLAGGVAAGLGLMFLLGHDSARVASSLADA